MVGCSVLGCKSRSERNVSGVTFHKYPSNSDILSKWMDATGKQNWIPNKYSKMCSLHFDDGSFIHCKKVVQLKKDSVPSRKIHIVPTPEEKEVPNSRECRSCLQTLKKDSLSYNIFQPCKARWNKTGNTIAKDLAKLANVQISETDRHSKLICDTCFHLLLSACRFKSLVRKNDQILRFRNAVSSKDQSGNSPKENTWPEPIQVDKCLINVTNNESLLNEDIKQEVKEECLTNDTYYEPKDVQNIDILKIEPEEIIQHQPSSIQEIVKERLSADDLNTELACTSDNTTTADDDGKMEEEWLIEEEEEKIEPIIPHLPIARTNDTNSVQGLKVQVIAQPSYKSVKRKGNNFPVGVKTIAPKTSAERAREFRARKALLKQQSKQQEPDAIVHIETTEDNNVPGPSDIRTVEKRAKSAESTRRWREKQKALVCHQKTQPKTAAERMREYRARKKLPFQYKKKVNQLICALCGETFTDDYYMKIHQDIHHSNIEENVGGSDKYNISTGDTPE